MKVAYAIASFAVDHSGVSSALAQCSSAAMAVPPLVPNDP